MNEDKFMSLPEKIEAKTVLFAYSLLVYFIFLKT